MKVKKGDNVKVISGKDRGKTAKVIKVFPKEDRILVEGVNMRKKHRKPRQQGKKGEIINLPAPMHVSNVMLVCPKCNQPTRVGYEKKDSGQKSRVCKKCGGEI
ncbi:MAG: 50S ribosomal protein L24 [Candidatus Sungbacteria bacterium RIFCSPLOWO2_12_FULL_41_11]|uniref:Large ribosomal subunit protein uL24 n=1 Tax=Candidatus Sungbacteria bacterium RIFCSPLOWO2_12_FULL_41_11 TaxID=1802286 RepID=A0A1G2LQQ0_9BACT|nr:MAG: 50S ribosomal protein L24 [Parcubacteria group bacterium GW2011_GWA2_42_14]OGZ98403.1 MAG: 50S ribosomal protein L24 [Candidatus Sungbacteria bacterium RIFCSPHIGHO2_02_FULL_41_12b]OHA13927.1 MAG: 50S ribosomal protein L24 [Candidatus Sungbacteria bacterium RIFCSPLOWO2_12_FULL_41_11]